MVCAQFVCVKIFLVLYAFIFTLSHDVVVCWIIFTIPKQIWLASSFPPTLTFQPLVAALLPKDISVISYN